MPKIASLAMAVLIIQPTSAAAHEFTAALLVVGEDQDVRLAEAVRGFLLAADERDGHDGETSDGHLGGVDVQILPLPREAAGLVESLTGTPQNPPDIVVVLGESLAFDALAQADPNSSLVVPAGVLPASWFEVSAPDGFVARYQRAFGTAPSEAAALGYHAARRLDAAIRPLDGVSPRADLEAALRATEATFQW